VVFFPAYYTLKEAMTGASSTPSEIITASLTRYRMNFVEDLQGYWAVWFPAMGINFTVCPMYARVPFIAAVSFGYTMYLSFLRGAID